MGEKERRIVVGARWAYIAPLPSGLCFLPVALLSHGHRGFLEKDVGAKGQDTPEKKL